MNQISVLVLQSQIKPNQTKKRKTETIQTITSDWFSSWVNAFQVAPLIMKIMTLKISFPGRSQGNNSVLNCRKTTWCLQKKKICATKKNVKEQKVN